jgi:hypothetical protein
MGEERREESVGFIKTQGQQGVVYMCRRIYNENMHVQDRQTPMPLQNFTQQHLFTAAANEKARTFTHNLNTHKSPHRPLCVGRKRAACHFVWVCISFACGCAEASLILGLN